MKISATVFVILILTYLVNASVLDPVIENVVHLKASKPPGEVPGIWKKKTIWKPRWVKEWKSAKVMKPVWRKVWSPVQIREWVPIPKPPPGWDSISTSLIPIHPKPQKAPKPLKDSTGHDSFTVHSTKVPLWDPVPYPESQQPPPLHFSPPLHNTDSSCDKGACDSSPSQTFSHHQISEIIGTRYQTPDHFQNPDFSETVNHLTRLPPDGNIWRSPQPLPIDNRFNNFQALPEFLVPPKFQSLSPVSNVPLSAPTPPFETQSVRNWIPLPPENKIKGHFITKETDQPYKFQFPEVEMLKNNTNVNAEGTQNPRKPQVSSTAPSQANGDFIQEAQLVGEYHYSEFDLPNIKPQTSLDDKTQVKTKTLQNNMQEEVQKHKSSQPVLENKQTQTETKQSDEQNSPHVQKKHIPNTISTNSNHFLQQDTFLKEIFPIYKMQQNSRHVLNPPFSPSKNTLSLNHSSTKLQPITNSTSSFTHDQKAKEGLQNVNPIFIPSNHRFSSLSEIKIQNLSQVENSEKDVKTKHSSLVKNNSVELVFATTPVDYNQLTDNASKSTTTEPYEIIFSSSLLATTETVTRSPLIIVTPANSNENS